MERLVANHNVPQQHHNWSLFISICTERKHPTLPKWGITRNGLASSNVLWHVISHNKALFGLGEAILQIQVLQGNIVIDKS